jgi:hypothetical protein
MAEAQPPKGVDGLADHQQTKRESRNEGRTGGIGMPALPAAVAVNVMICRLISMWLVLLVGWSEQIAFRTHCDAMVGWPAGTRT